MIQVRHCLIINITKDKTSQVAKLTARGAEMTSGPSPTRNKRNSDVFENESSAWMKLIIPFFCSINRAAIKISILVDGTILETEEKGWLSYKFEAEKKFDVDKVR